MDSELIVILPLIGAILGAVVGAFGGAYANSRTRDREAKKARDEERKGLLVLISAEVRYNLKLLDLIWDGGPSGPIQILQTDVWDKTQVRVAQLLPSDYIEEVTDLYSLIAVNRVSSIAHKDNYEDMTEPERKAIGLIMDKGFSILRRAQCYVTAQQFAASINLLDKQVRREK